MNTVTSSDEAIVLILDRMSLAPGNTTNLMKQCFDLHIDEIKKRRHDLPGWKGVLYRCRDRALSSLCPVPLSSDSKAAAEYIEKIMLARYHRMLEDEQLLDN